MNEGKGIGTLSPCPRIVENLGVVLREFEYSVEGLECPSNPK